MEKHPVHLYIFSHYYSQTTVLGSNSIVATNILYTNHVNYMATENLSERKKEGRERRRKIFNPTHYLGTPYKI